MAFNSLTRLLVVFGVAFFSTVLSPPVSSAQLKIEDILNKLDDNYYYPQKNGLAGISARLEWEQRDMSSSSETYLKNPGFRFNAEFNNGISSKGFSIDEGTVILSDDEKTQYLRILNNYADAFIPKTLLEQLSNYSGEVISAKKREVLLRFESSDSLETVKGYGLFVDPTNWRLASIQVRQENEPLNVEGKFKYTRKGGRWAVVETMTSFLMNDQNFSERTEYTYKKFKSFWLVHKVRQTLRREGQIVLSYRFRLVDYEVSSKN